MSFMIQDSETLEELNASLKLNFPNKLVWIRFFKWNSSREKKLNISKLPLKVFNGQGCRLESAFQFN